MSTVLFDTPGPRARRRHRIIAVVFGLVVLAVCYWAYAKLHEEGVLTADVANDVLQDRNVEFLWEGFLKNLQAAVLAIACSLVFGLVFAAGRLSDRRSIRLPCAAVIEFFRSVPLVLLILFIFYQFRGIGILGCLVLGLTLYNGSVLAEVYRAGIVAVQRGQSEAAYALGMRKSQVMVSILLPQAVKFMLPAIISQCVIVLKDTSLGFIIVYEEAVRRGRTVAQFVDDGALITFSVVAAAFILVNYSLSKLAEYLERRLARRGETPLDADALDT